MRVRGGARTRSSLSLLLSLSLSVLRSARLRSAPLCSARFGDGNERRPWSPICPRKTKNLFHARWMFLAFSAGPATPDTVVVRALLRGTGIVRNNENTNYGSTVHRSSRDDNQLGVPGGRREIIRSVPRRVRLDVASRRLASPPFFFAFTAPRVLV